MISERRAFLDAYAKEEEQLVFLQMRKELLTTLLKNKHTMRDGIETDLEVARDNAIPSGQKTAKDFLFRLAGRKKQQTARAGIRHNFAADLTDQLRADVPVIEEEVRDLIGLRAATAKAFDETRKQADTTRLELVKYISALRDNPKEALAAYREAARAHRLLTNAAESGRTYYTYLRALQKQLQGARATAKRPIGNKPYFDILLQRAYTRQGELWSESAESLQIEFLTDLRTLEAMTPHKFRTAGQIAFSTYFFDSTLTKLLTFRKGDEVHELLEQAADELATVLLAVEEARTQAAAQLHQNAEGAGLVM